MRDAVSIASNVADTGAVVARPLYLQVREMLLSRIDKGQWSVGDALPNEQRLSAQFGVSIGTIRKAIDFLEETGVVVRQQGRGTYLAGLHKEKMVERFNPLRLPNGERPKFTYRLEALTRRAPSREERARLDLPLTAEIHVVEQALLLDRTTVGREWTCIDTLLVPELEGRLGGGQDLHILFAHSGLAIAHAEDTVSVGDTVPAGALCASMAHRPVWVLGRLSRSVTRPIELKTGWYGSSHLIYVGSL